MAESNLRALTALRRLRKIETDAARGDLAQTLAAEVALAARDAAVAAEVETARLFTGDFDRQSFFHWLERMRTERTRLAESLLAAEAGTAAARAALAGRRVAETAAEQALDRAALAKAAEAARRDQVMLEDVARTLKRAADTSSGSRQQ
jgi:hypothetical protein